METRQGPTPTLPPLAGSLLVGGNGKLLLLLVIILWQCILCRWWNRTVTSRATKRDGAIMVGTPMHSDGADKRPPHRQTPSDSSNRGGPPRRNEPWWPHAAARPLCARCAVSVGASTRMVRRSPSQLTHERDAHRTLLCRNSAHRCICRIIARPLPRHGAVLRRLCSVHRTGCVHPAADQSAATLRTSVSFSNSTESTLKGCKKK